MGGVFVFDLAEAVTDEKLQRNCRAYECGANMPSNKNQLEQEPQSTLSDYD